MRPRRPQGTRAVLVRVDTIVAMYAFLDYPREDAPTNLEGTQLDGFVDEFVTAVRAR